MNKNGVSCTSNGPLFEIHACKSKRCLHLDLKQTPQLCVAHPMFFFGIPEYPLDGFFSLYVATTVGLCLVQMAKIY